MDVREVFKSQYLASLEMLKQAVEKCPQALWADAEPKNKFWHIAYHALFYTHLYLSDSEKDFTPWKRHRDNSQFLGPIRRLPEMVPNTKEPYSRQEVLDYLDFCQKMAGKKVPGIDLDAESGFYWLPFNKTELQVYSIRHLQHHTGQLIERLRSEHDIEIRWVGMESR